MFPLRSVRSVQAVCHCPTIPYFGYLLTHSPPFALLLLFAFPNHRDMPPAGGFEAVKYKRNLPFRGPSGLVILAGVTAVCAYGFYRLGKGNLEKRYVIHSYTPHPLNPNPPPVTTHLLYCFFSVIHHHHRPPTKFLSSLVLSFL